ncbi:aminotransferase class I/II-fold pyridoxal phosphate-dependent enzyme [Faecalicoccus acidiformans]|uniref:aminotransferase class I/II-fold pyridoxal phosphate-dependent enzyme n=1 Tax=Faecalicoccus acidiformans TaxID=915173 RepID=UPI0025A398AE|nr:aminotransferase class I/II-fold pyridoxal phosphate-dependent enzyme [Faecalicoccus acidiformans]MDM8202972.1 aminotransferase class I/II-fold pyridoxal phosphate-dependent enzyme [Faecalicoccus acidiformans]
MIKSINPTVKAMKPSGIRKFFDLANTMKGVISLGVGEPDFDTPWHICENAIHSMSVGKTHYTANRGLLELRQAICQFHAIRYHQNYDPEHETLVTVGGSEAIDLAMRTLVEPGDEVIVLDPNYVAYAPTIELAGGIPVPIVLKEETEFKLLPGELKAAITPKTKAMIINYPSNPTGGVMTKEDYEKLVPIIKESGIYVVSDEIYAELSFDQEFASLAQFDEVRDQIIVVNGFSKAFAMTGWRLGYALANRDVSDAMTKIHQYVIMSAPTQAQYAAIEAMTHGLDDVIRMRNDYLNRRNLLVNRLNRMGLDTNMPHGTFYVFPNIQKTGMTCEEFCEKLLEKEKVACVPGNAFGEHGEGFIRISYAYSIDHLKEACDRIEHFLQNLD